MSTDSTLESPVQSFREHAVEQVTGRLLAKAEAAMQIKNYAEVIKIGALQFPYNVSAVSVYYDLLRGDTYDRMIRLSFTATAEVSEYTRSCAIIDDLRRLTEYYKNHLAGREPKLK